MCTIEVDAVTHGILKYFADATGVTLRAAATEAIQDWMEVNGEPILKSLERQRAARAAQGRTAQPVPRVLAFKREAGQ